MFCRQPADPIQNDQATEEIGTGHGRGRKNPRTGPAGAVTLTSPPGSVALTSRYLIAAVISLFSGLALRPGVTGCASGDEVANAGILGIRGRT